MRKHISSSKRCKPTGATLNTWFCYLENLAHTCKTSKWNEDIKDNFLGEMTVKKSVFKPGSNDHSNIVRRYKELAAEDIHGKSGRWKSIGEVGIFAISFGECQDWKQLQYSNREQIRVPKTMSFTNKNIQLSKTAAHFHSGYHRLAPVPLCTCLKALRITKWTHKNYETAVADSLIYADPKSSNGE